jgi:hypothetical protein
MNDYLAELNAFQINKRVRVASLALVRADGEETRTLRPGDSLTIRLGWEAQRPSRFALISGWMNADSGETVLSAWSGDDGYFVDASAGSGTVEVHYESLPLSPGRYHYWVCLADPAQGPFPVEYCDVWGPLTGQDSLVLFEGDAAENSLVRLPVQWRLEAA